MQTTEDGEYIPEKELNTNFKIPKKKPNNETNNDTNAFINNVQYDQQPVPANSYYDYQTYNMGVPVGTVWPQTTPNGFYDPTTFPVHYTGEGTSDAISQAIFNNLTSHKERPKNYRKDIFKETVPDCDDASLPKELIAMFQPLYCKLCSSQLSSNVMAKLHYKSKNHEKKIRKFLIDYSEKTGEPLHKRAKVTPTKTNKKEDDNPSYFHCEICDLPLTGKLHAESHYMGKNHMKAVMGLRQPAGKGFYNVEGKWIRTPSKKQESENGDDNFGLDFRTGVPGDKVKIEVPPTQSKFLCDVCKISATCQQQLDMHFKGQKHLKKLRQLGLNANIDKTITEKNLQHGTTTDATIAPCSTLNISDDLLSAYRTPSGQYYCQTCNLTLNSEVQFKTHLNSKNHYKKSTQK